MKRNEGISRLVQAVNAGDSAAWGQLVDLAYDPLRRHAHALYRGERHTVGPTEMLHEVLVELDSTAGDRRFENSGHFFAYVSATIRRRLLDHVRAKNALKRGGGQRADRSDWNDAEAPASLSLADMIDLHDALDRLRLLNERLWIIVEMKYFDRATNGEVAEALGLGLSTIEADWTFTKAWLRAELASAHDA